MNKKNRRGSKKWLLEEKRLKMEANELLYASMILQFEAERIYNKILEITGEVSGGVGFERSEEIYKEMPLIEKRLGGLDKSLKKLDEEYAKLQTRINEFYGREVLRPLEMERDEKREDEGKGYERDGDWWKTG